MFKWFSKLKNFQKLLIVMGLIAIIFTTVLLGVLAFKNRLDAELNNPVVGLLNAQKDSQASAEEASSLELKMDKTEANVEAGKTLQLTAKIEGEAGDNKVTWDSSDEKIATVDESGLVTAKAVGTVTIRVKLNDKKTAISVIKVTEPPKPEPKPAPAPAPTASGGSSSSSEVLNQNAVLIEGQILTLINVERTKAGKSAIINNDLLQKAARVRAKEESSDGQDHTRPNSSEWSTIFNEVGFSGATALGENVGGYGGMGLITVEDANKIAGELVNMWMNSPDHKRNILGEQYNYNLIGVGVNIVDNNYYAVQLFAQK